MVARRYPETVNLRYLAAPVATALNAAGLVVGLAGVLGAAAGAGGFVPYLGFGLVVPFTYVAGVTGVAVALAGDQPARVRVRVPAVLAAMHMCWGAGYLTSPRRLAERRH